uniref:Uncharacterized protein n=1 Tax=Ditylenchus dipsaci TaxID=166011 RepID=A0A915DPZ0_9BILA
MCEELDTNKARREQMQYGGLPPVILQQLHSHQPISSALYSESSCLQCDLCYFSAIKVHCSAGEVISLMASLFQSYDRLIAMYKSIIVQFSDVNFSHQSTNPHMAENEETIKSGKAKTGQQIQLHKELDPKFEPSWLLSSYPPYSPGYVVIFSLRPPQCCRWFPCGSTSYDCTSFVTPTSGGGSQVVVFRS